MRRAALIIFDIVLLQAICVAVFVLAMKGFCFQERRFVALQEIEHAAVRHELRTFPPSVSLRVNDLGEGRSVETFGVPENAQRYAGVSAFLAENPGGCQLVERGIEGYRPSGLSRLFGVEFHIVRLRYDVRFYEQGRLRVIPYESFVTVNRCGRVVTL